MIRNRYARVRAFVLCACFLFVFLSVQESSSVLHAQNASSLPIAVSVFVSEDEAAYGDIVAYHQENGTYTLTEEENDARVFGVLAQRPPLVYRVATNTVPVVRFGQTAVNVTLENGPIASGDRITTSSVPGKGQRAGSDQSNVIGIAAESFTETDGIVVTTPSGEEYVVGTIMVNMDMDLLRNDAAAVDSTGLLRESGEELDEALVITIVRYIVATAVVAGSILLASRNSISTLQQGVVSIGRNPRARTSIIAMVIVNTLISLLIIIVGFLIATGIIFINL